MPERLFWGALIGLTAAAVWLIARFRRTIAIGSAYKAKVLCSLVFGSRRAVDPRRAEEVSADSYRVARLLTARIDSNARSVTVSFLGLGPRVATYDPELGAALGGPRPGQHRAPAAFGPRPARAPWPVREG